jgi:hypothetical protein
MNPVLRQASQFVLSKKLPTYHRFLFKQYDLKDRLVGIRGARGSGKTTLMLQYAHACGVPLSKIFYVACDHPAMVGESLYELALEFYQEGGKLLLIDEIHKAKDFAQALKAIYDTFELQVVFSGSSALQISQQASDLSRRAVLFHLPVLSLREYMEIETGLSFKPVSLTELIEHHQDIAYEYTKALRPIEYFNRYCLNGAYPFYQESADNYPLKLLEVINHTIDVDLTSIFNIDPSKRDKLKKVLYMLCTTPPLEINKVKLSAAVETSWPTLTKYLELMQAGDLVYSLRASSGMRSVNKPDKLLLNNPNLFNVLCASANRGSLRESFFVSQVKQSHQVHYYDQGDFIVDDTWVFEIGGRSKTTQQLNQQQGYLALDGIETGAGQRIPLWMFGLLY